MKRAQIFSLLAVTAGLTLTGCQQKADEDHVTRFATRSYQTGSNIPRPSTPASGMDMINGSQQANGSVGGIGPGAGGGSMGGGGAVGGGR